MSGPMVHPSMRNQPQNYPVHPPENMVVDEIFCVIVSKYSASCKQIFDTVKFIAPHLNTRILEIDNPEIRQMVMESGKIATVPCIALMYPFENKIEFYEGQEAIHVLNKASEKVKEKLARLSPQPPVNRRAGSPPRGSSLKDVMDQEEEPEMDNLKATPNERMNPSNLPPGQGHDNMQSSSLPTGHRGAAEPFSERRQTDKSNSGFDFPVIDDTAAEHVGSGGAGGMNLEEILGNNSGMANREKDKRSHSTKASVESMMAQRDAEEAQLAARRKPNI